MTKPPITEADYARAAQSLGVEIAAIKAVAEVESRGDGFLETGEPVILFERHIFSRLTKGKYDKTHPDISNPKSGGYGKESEQHARLQRAVKLDRDAALQSASWGKFQVLGKNWEDLKYAGLQEFVNAMYRSEADHLDSFVRFIDANNLAGALRGHKWATFARIYNGPQHAKHNYAGRLAQAYSKYAKKQ